MELLLDLFGSTQSIPVMLVNLDLVTLVKRSLIATANQPKSENKDINNIITVITDRSITKQ